MAQRQDEQVEMLKMLREMRQESAALRRSNQALLERLDYMEKEKRLDADQQFATPGDAREELGGAEDSGEMRTERREEPCEILREMEAPEEQEHGVPSTIRQGGQSAGSDDGDAPTDEGNAGDAASVHGDQEEGGQR